MAQWMLEIELNPGACYGQASSVSETVLSGVAGLRRDCWRVGVMMEPMTVSAEVGRVNGTDVTPSQAVQCEMQQAEGRGGGLADELMLAPGVAANFNCSTAIDCKAVAN